MEMPNVTDIVTGLLTGSGPKTDPRELSVRDLMSPNVVAGGANDTVFSAARLMSENRVSCVVILEGTSVIGILTQRDMLTAVTRRDIDFRRLRISECMSGPVETVPAALSVMKAGEIMEARNIRRLPVVEDDQLVGIVTQTDITRGLASLSPLQTVRDIMTTRVATVRADATITESARIMASNDISCLVAMHRDDIAGILTEKDLLKRVIALQKDPAETKVADVMSVPVTTIPPRYSVLSAGKKMEALHVRRLVVMDGNQIHGIVTQTDLMRAIRNELEQLESKRGALTAGLQALVRQILLDPVAVQEALREFVEAQEAGEPVSDTAPL